MKRLFITLIAAVALIASAKADDIQQSYTFRSAPADIHGRFNNPAPFFVIFPDSRIDKDQAQALVDDSGIRKVMDEYGGTAMIMNPLGSRYDNAKDFAEYEAFINKMRVIFNLKVIGIGNGATFVNETIAHRAGNVAGILTVGGKSSKKAAAGESPVPAYIAGKNATSVASAYISRSKAVVAEKNGTQAIYINADEPLMRVAVRRNNATTLKEVFEDAWTSVLSWNYRFNNYNHTWYTGESYCEHGDYELEPFLVFERMGINRNVCTENLAGTGDYLWYEYYTDSFKTAAPGTVPLVVLLHGNNNDPRTQAETSGFLPIAAREGFMVAELEWQGNGWAVMGHDGIETVVYELFNKYPQIDRSRVYAEGLSAGAFNATALGIKKTHVFAAVGAQSGGVMPALRFGSSQSTLFDEATLKSEGCDMPYFSISGVADEVVPFPSITQKGPNTISLAWQAYQILNNLPYSKSLDFEKYPLFGIPLENLQRVATNKGIYYQMGDQLSGGIPLMRVVGTEGYGHWNFQPGAELMWEYFKLFSRDIATKKLIYHGN